MGLELGAGGPPARRWVDGGPERRPVQLDLPRLAACAMPLAELIPFGLPATVAEVLPRKGIRLAGELAGQTLRRLEHLFPGWPRFRWQWVPPIAPALGRVGLDLGLLLPGGWKRRPSARGAS